MTKNTEIFFISILLLLPISLITGPAIPDITISLSGIFFVWHIILKKNYNQIYEDKLFLISIFFWLYLLIISFFAENQYLSFRDALVFIRLLLIPIFIIYFVKIDLKFIEKVTTIIFICVVFVIGDTLFQFLQYKSESGFGSDLLGFKSNWYGRLTGPFGDELIPGAYLSRFSFLGLIFLFLKLNNNKYFNLFCIFYLSLLGLTIFATGERMAFATYSLGLFFLLIFMNKRRLIFFYSIMILIFSIIIVQNIHPSYNDFKIIKSTPYHLGLTVEKEFNCELDNEKKCFKILKLQPQFSEIIKNFNVSPYGEIYKLSLKMFLDNKFFGVGLNNFTDLCNNHKDYKNIIKNYVCVSHPHNIYIQWLVETGFIGFIIFISYICLIIYKIIFKNVSEFSIIAITPILILFWPIMSTGSLLKNWNGVGTFFIIGLCIIISRLKKP